MQPRIDHKSPLYHQGGTLLEELKFIHHYHSDKRNQTLHLVTTWTALTLISLLIWMFSAWYDAIILPCAYILYYAYLDIYVAAIWSALFGLSFAANYGIVCLIQEGIWTWTALCAAIAASIAVLMLAFRGVGHLVFEKALPAFRLFEFAVTTPFFLAYATIWNIFGHAHFRSDLHQRIHHSESKISTSQ